MRIVSLTQVGNESEIIESFIRYNSNFIDKMFILPVCSVDNTLTIIRELIAEGGDCIELLEEEEPDISFEQKYLDNKYMKKIAREENADLFIPLDADEFLIGDSNPRTIMEGLALDRVYQVGMKNYAMSPEDDLAEPFIPKRLTNHKVDFFGDRIAKVLIPARLILANHITLGAGHHGAYGEKLVTQPLYNLALAHYPAISQEQYVSKIYGYSITYMTWMNRGDVEGDHISKQIMELETGCDIYDAANRYSSDASIEVKWEYDPINLSYCRPGSLEIKYADLAAVNLLHNMHVLGQLMAIKAYNLKIDQQEESQLPRVLVFGTGNQAAGLLDDLPDSLVNIRAYIDINQKKKFSMFHKRLVITPEYIRFFRFSRIIIANEKYYDTAKELLTRMGVDEEKICGLEYLFELMEIQRSERV